LRVVEREITPRQRELYFGGRARRQTNFLESLELANGPRHARRAITNIELSDFLGFTLAGVRDSGRNGQSRVPSQRLGAELRQFIIEPRVSEAMTERIQRLVRHFAITRFERRPFITLR